MSTTMTPTDTGTRTPMRTGLTDEQRSVIAEHLQATLAELLDLTLQAKQAHWTVTGPLFRPLHLQLDEMVDRYREWTDQVAERMTSVGLWPDGQIEAIRKGSPFDQLPQGAIEDREVVGLFVERLAQTASHTRDRVERLDDVDLVSQDVLLEILGGLEEQLWMLQAQRA